MKKNRIVIFLLLCMWTISTGFNNEEGREQYYVGNMQCLRPYVRILDEINEEYGTDFAIPNKTIAPGVKVDEQSLIAYYTNIDIDTFKDFVINSYVNGKTQESVNDEPVIAPRAFNGRQYANFTNGNRLYIDSSMHTVNGVDYYSKIISYGDSIKSYPAYLAKDNGLRYVFQDGYRKVYCVFECQLYVSPVLMAAVEPREIELHFTAGAGDIYPSI